MELDLIAVLLILKLENLPLKALYRLILHLLDLKQGHVRLLLERDHLVLHFLLVLQVVLLDILNPLELLDHLGRVLLADFGDVIMVAFL